MRSILYLTCIALGATVLHGCGSQVEGRVADQDAPAPEVFIPIQADRPFHADISSYFETTSRVVAENRVEVVSKGTGECVRVHVEEGDLVEEGQVLAELDKAELQAQMRQTQVNVDQQRAAYRIAEESLREGIGAQMERDNARFGYEQALATLELQQVQLRHQTIRAPISGVVTQRNIQQGIMVSAGMPVFSIVDPTSYVLPINPPEKELPNLSIGQTARVSIDAKRGEEFEARVRRINPAVDPTSGTVRVLLDFDEEVRENLHESAFARVRLVMETREDALVVPKDAIIEEAGRHYLMLVRELEPEDADMAADRAEPVKVAERVEIEKGLEDSDLVEVLSGVTEGSLIVTLGQHTLKSGAMVTITTAEKEILSRADLTTEEALELAHERRGRSSSGQDRRERLITRR